jgi:hypothetical protein
MKLAIGGLTFVIEPLISVNYAEKSFMKFTTGVNIINILRP